MNVYLAGPLFSTAEKQFNSALKAALARLDPKSNYILPQEFADSIADHPAFFELVFQNCVKEVRNCDVVVALLDGADVDSGTCIELGIGFALHKRLIGVRTDSRPGEDQGMNLMVTRALDELLQLPEADVETLAREITSVLTE